MTGTDPGPRLPARWSAPRCRSTAFLPMMVERADREVVDGTSAPDVRAHPVLGPYYRYRF